MNTHTAILKNSSLYHVQRDSYPDFGQENQDDF